MTYRVGIDSGGTFTDFLLVDQDGRRELHKTNSTPGDPARAVVVGLTELAGRIGLEASDLIRQLDVIVHGTTVTTNALLTRGGAHTGLLCTEGFRDTLPLRDGRREEPYNNRLPMPVPLVPRFLRLAVAGRLDHTGKELTPLDEAAVRAAALTFRAAEVKAVTICLIHSPANGDHEKRAAQIIREVLPDTYLTVSSDLLSQVGLFDRTSTAVLNSYVAPIISGYMRSLTEQLAVAGFTGVLRLMQSNGGVASSDALTDRAVLSLLSGPASGPVAGIAVVAPLEQSDCITIDMGGTSFDAAIVQGGNPLVMTDGWVDRWRLALPMLDIHTVGAGGGSVAYTNAGLLQVGPFSAGADPGPACYGRGGHYATVTDADLILGYVGRTLIGGAMSLDLDAAAAAISQEVAAPLDLTVLEAAAGIYEVVNVNMAEGVREVTVNRGWDPRDFPLVVAGGAGPVHAAAIADELDIPVLVVPRESSVFCAGGMLLADFKHDYVRSLRGELEKVAAEDISSRWATMAAEGTEMLSAEGIPVAEHDITPAVDLRYKGQWHELTIDAAREEMAEPDLGGLAKRFHQRHDLLFGYHTPEMAIEIRNVRLAITGHTTKTAALPVSTVQARPAAVPLGRRDAWSRRGRRMIPFEVFDGLELLAGHRLKGPCLIELTTTTIVVPEGFNVVVDRHGSYVLYVDSHADQIDEVIRESPATG